MQTAGRLVRVGLALAVCALTFAGPVAAPAGAAVQRLHATVTAATVLTRASVSITGTELPLPSGGRIVLQRLVSGHWLTVKRATLARSGKFAVSVAAPAHAGRWTLRVIDSKTLGKTSKAVVLHVQVTTHAYKVTAAGPLQGRAGVPLLVHGTVTPKAKGGVRLQVLRAGLWRNLGTAKLTVHSTYSVRATLPIGRWRVRVVKAFSASVAGGVSPGLSITVLKAPITGQQPDKVPPSIAITLGGSSASTGSYAGPTTVTIAAADDPNGSGLRSVSYALDGAAAHPYTGPVAVASLGRHTVTGTAIDNAGNTATASQTWTIVAPPTPGDLTTGGTVTSTCQVTGFDGVLPNTAGNQCAAGDISFGPSGLSLTSTAGQLANDDQQNALYRSFAATGNAWTVTARVVGPVNQLTHDYEQIGAWFGPDQNNFVKVEAEHNGTGGPHLTMFYLENGAGGTVDSVALPALTSASTVDLVIKGTNHTSLAVYYSLNGGALVQVGTSKSPAAAASWFSASAKAGILVSNSGSSTPITATFSRLTIASS